jgi:hypothetical protein
MATQSFAFDNQISMDSIHQTMFGAAYRSCKNTLVDGLPDCLMGDNDVFYRPDETSGIEPNETFYEACDVLQPEPSAPPMPTSSHGLLAWYILDENVSEDELTPELITKMESMWFKITGHPFAMYMADGDLFNIIQNLQFREHQILRLYNNGHPTSRVRMMDLHSRFFEEFGSRISDFYSNESFKRMTDDILSETFV